MAHELPVKRLYLPGQALLSVCPECGDHRIVDLGSDHLSYPMVGAPNVLTMRCRCGAKWDIEYELTVSARVLPSA